MFSEGDEVAIAIGAFSGLGGIFKFAAGKERAEVLLGMLGKERPITVSLGDLVQP